MEPIASSWLFTTLFTTIPFAIAGFFFFIRNGRRDGFKRFIRLFIIIFSLALSIGTIVNSIIGIALSVDISYADRHECCWVALGLGIGALVVSVIGLVCNLISYLHFKRDQRRIRKTRVQTNVETKSVIEKSSNDMSYIEEIKQLKELLDMGAITQEEYDEKKKKLLNL